MKSLSCVRLLATPWTAAHQAPPSKGFSRQEYWSRVPWSLSLVKSHHIQDIRSTSVQALGNKVLEWDSLTKSAGLWRALGTHTAPTLGKVSDHPSRCHLCLLHLLNAVSQNFKELRPPSHHSSPSGLPLCHGHQGPRTLVAHWLFSEAIAWMCPDSNEAADDQGNLSSCLRGQVLNWTPHPA